MLKQTDLVQFIGDLERWRHPIGRFIYTPGVKFVADNAEAYWLLDVIGSHQPAIAKAAKKDYRLSEMQFWTVVPDGKGGCVVSCVADSCEPEVVRQEIEYTDLFSNFDGKEVKIWLEFDGECWTAMLPSER